MTPQQQQAVDELSLKSLAEIQVETAYTWAYRAWAAKSIAAESPSKRTFLQFMNDATEYEHEALEHAALSGSDKVLSEVRRIVTL